MGPVSNEKARRHTPGSPYQSATEGPTQSVAPHPLLDLGAGFLDPPGNLVPEHERMLLEESAIPAGLVQSRGYQTVEHRDHVPDVFSNRQRRCGLLIPVWWRGEVVQYQLRPSAPLKSGSGKVRKYEWPTGQPLRLDCHPATQHLLDDAAVPLWITEGVKKGDALAGHGQVCVALNGVWCWQKKGEPLSDWDDVKLDERIVYIAYDSDVMTKSEVKAALRKLTDFLNKRGAECRWVHLPEGPDGEKVGVDDYLATGGTLATLTASAERPADGGTTEDRWPLTDYGNAERLVAYHGRNVRFCPPWRQWLIWDGGRWRRDETGEIDRLAKRTVRATLAASAELNDDDRRQKLAAHALRSESAAKLRNMVSLAATEADIPVMPAELDADPWLLNVANGTVDLRDGGLRAPRRNDLMTKATGVPYDADAECPLWDRFMARVLPDADDRAFVQRAVGYSLTGSTRAQVMFLLWGTGANGKSTFLETVRAIIGDYSRQASSDLLLAKRNSGIPADVAELHGARFVSAVETDEGRRLAEALVKQLTGGDRVTARRLYGQFFEFDMQGKLWLATNSKPSVKGTNEGIWRRIRLIPFTVQVPEGERDPDLGAKLTEELPGILRWAIEGCLAWQRDGLKPSYNIQSATSAYRDEQDLFGSFIAERCTVGDGLWASAADIYTEYEMWAAENNLKPLTKQMIGRMLGDRGFQSQKQGADRTRGYVGIAPQPPTPPAIIRAGKR